MKKIILAGSAANALEWYDFALYASFSSILSKKFFPSYDPSTALLATYVVFAVGFLMRPLGAVLFGTIGDKFGRKSALSLAILLMSIPTALVGVLPTYETIGVAAPILLTVMRLLQGLSLGGALIGSASYIVEHASPKNRGISGSFTMFSLCFGFMTGSAIAWALSTYLSVEAFESYGWRLPFLFGIVIIGMSYYFRYHALESPEFKKTRDAGHLIKNPFRELLNTYKLVMFSSILINSLGSVGFYALAVYVAGYLQTTRDLSLSDVSIMSTWSMAVIMFSVVFAGWLSDVFGRKLWFVLIAIITAILIWPVCAMIETGGYTEIFIAQIIFALLVGCWIGPEPALQIEMYPTYVRNTGVSVSYNLGCAIFGGATPVIFKMLFGYFQSVYVVACYIVLVALLSLVGLFFYKNRI